MSRTNQIVVAMLATVALAAAFWILALSPKREEANRLQGEVDQARATLSKHEEEVSQALEAKRTFADDYRQMVVLGKAVPREDDTASLLVQLTAIAKAANIRFQEIKLSEGEAGETGASGAPVAANPAEPAPPTEVAAALLPLGATIGPAGLGAMPYTLKFTGNFTHIADFIKGLDEFVDSTNAGVKVDGRLITINGFSLEPPAGGSLPQLEATFSITTYLTPPDSGAAEAPAEAALETATPTATVTGGTP